MSLKIESPERFNPSFQINLNPKQSIDITNPDTTIAFLTEGSITTHTLNSKGKRRGTSFFRAPSLAGNKSFLYSIDSPYTLTALEKAKINIYDKRLMDFISLDTDDLAMFTNAASNDYTSMQRLVSALSTPDSLQKVFNILNLLTQQNNEQITIPIPDEALAYLAGLNRARVAEYRNMLKQKGFIQEISKHQFKITEQRSSNHTHETLPYQQFQTEGTNLQLMVNALQANLLNEKFANFLDFSSIGGTQPVYYPNLEEIGKALQTSRTHVNLATIRWEQNNLLIRNQQRDNPFLHLTNLGLKVIAALKNGERIEGLS